MNQRKMGTTLSYLHIFLANTISILYTPYMLQMMGQSEYGLYGTAGSFISYLSILSFGIGGAYIRFNARCRAANDREGEKQLNGMFLTVFSVLALLVLAGGISCAVLAEELVDQTFTPAELYKLRIIILLLTINMMITFVFNVVMMALNAYEKYIALRGMSLVTCILTPIVNIIALRMGGRSITITAIALAISIASYLFCFFYARKAIKMEFSFKGFRKDVLKEIFVFSGFLFLNSITDQITFSTDNIVLGAVHGTEVVAVYTVGAQFKNYFHQFSGGIAGVFSPKINFIAVKNMDTKEFDDIFTQVGRIQFYVVALILIGYISVGRAFICIWAGTNYNDSFLIGLFLILSVVVPSLQNIGLEVQKAMNKHKARSVVYFLIALANVALTIPCAKQWGGIGAAFATLVTTFFGYVVFMNYYYWKHIGLNIPGFWWSICKTLPGLIAPAVVGFMINRYWPMDSYLDVLLGSLSIVVIFCASVWMISMNREEKNLFLKPLRRFIGR